MNATEITDVLSVIMLSYILIIIQVINIKRRI